MQPERKEQLVMTTEFFRICLYRRTSFTLLSAMASKPQCPWCGSERQSPTILVVLTSPGPEEHFYAPGRHACIARGIQFIFAKSLKVLKFGGFFFFLVLLGTGQTLKIIK